MSNIFDKYQKEIIGKLKEEFGFKNTLAAPKIEKIVVNASIADAQTSRETGEKVKEQLATICGQAPRFTRAKKSIASFKLREGDMIGLSATMRGKMAWNFLEKLIAVVIPRMRDFRGMPTSKFDKFGNYSFGISEQILFPEIDYSKIDKIRGLVVSVVIKNSNREKSQRFLELLGIPFK